MIAKLTGRLDGSGADWLIVDVAGVGYLVYASARTVGEALSAGDTVSLHIETHVREDHIHLYGFMETVERDWFRLLMTVQGVGARVALAILSTLAPDDLAASVAAGDAAPLTRAAGVGKKLAGRIVSELKDKFGEVEFAPAAPAAGGNGKAKAAAPSAEAVSALVNLGYGRTEAFSAVAQAAKKLGDEAPVEALIKAGLSELGGEARA